MNKAKMEERSRHCFHHRQKVYTYEVLDHVYQGSMFAGSGREGVLPWTVDIRTRTGRGPNYLFPGPPCKSLEE